MRYPFQLFFQSAQALAALAQGAVSFLFKRPLPDPMATTGVKRRFRMASLLGLIFFTSLFAQKPPPNGPTGDKPSMPQQDKAKLFQLLRALWKALDPSKNEAFSAHVHTAVQSGYLTPEVASMLKESYTELSHHQEMMKGKVTCYKMNQVGFTVKTSREKVIAQLEILRDAVAKGTLPPDLAETARKTLRLELAFEHRARKSAGDQEALAALLEAYQNGTLSVTQDEEQLTKNILELESRP